MRELIEERRGRMGEGREGDGVGGERERVNVEEREEINVEREREG